MGRSAYKLGWCAIYALHDPRNGDVRYVGKSTNPKRRLADHLYASKTAACTPLHFWIQDLSALGLAPEQRIILWALDAHSDDLEAEEISRTGGLLNRAPGGMRMSFPRLFLREFPAYGWAVAFCRRTKNKTLSRLLRRVMRRALSRGRQEGYRFDEVIEAGIREAGLLLAANRVAANRNKISVVNPTHK